MKKLVEVDVCKFCGEEPNHYTIAICNYCKEQLCWDCKEEYADEFLNGVTEYDHSTLYCHDCANTCGQMNDAEYLAYAAIKELQVEYDAFLVREKSAIKKLKEIQERLAKK